MIWKCQRKPRDHEDKQIMATKFMVYQIEAPDEATARSIMAAKSTMAWLDPNLTNVSPDGGAT